MAFVDQEFEDLPYKLEANVPLSQSVLWDLQWRYYEEQGADAWRNGQVPHYATSNPTVANCYADIVLAFRRDYLRQARILESDCPQITICELGAGSGRLAYHTIRILDRLSEPAGDGKPAFRYVMTDFAQSNLDAWKANPKFRSFFERGLVDVALFDVRKTVDLELEISGERVTSGNLSAPIIVVANYLFDSVPQRLYYFDRQQTRECMVSLSAAADPETASTSELVASLKIQYTPNSIPELILSADKKQRLLATYQDVLTDSYVLFPSDALNCLDRLNSLSKSGMLLLTADKGDHSLNDLDRQSAPPLVRHGSFSFTVNYHAFEEYFAQAGGISLLPNSQGAGISFGAFIVTKNAERYRQTASKYRQNVLDSSPVDFRTLAGLVRKSIDDINIDEALSFVRLSHYDAYQMFRILPRILELRDDMSEAMRKDIVKVVDEVWDGYLPIGESTDLANHFGRLLYELDEYAAAITYFFRSIELYGDQTTTLFSLASAYYQTKDYAAGGSILCTILERDPEYITAQELLDKCVEGLSTLGA
jgi:tetratricopeptide (TPR) repeat protein